MRRDDDGGCAASRERRVDRVLGHGLGLLAVEEAEGAALELSARVSGQRAKQVIDEEHALLGRLWAEIGRYGEM